MMRLCLVLLLLLTAWPALAGSVTVAVASNFLTTMEEIASRFETETGHEVVVAHGYVGRF